MCIVSSPLINGYRVPFYEGTTVHRNKIIILFSVAFSFNGMVTLNSSVTTRFVAPSAKA